MLTEQFPFRDDLSQGGPRRSDLDLLGNHPAAGIEHKPLAEAVDARLVIANRLEAPGAGIDLGFEEFVANHVGGRVPQAHARYHGLRSRRPFLRDPGEAKRGNFNHGAQPRAVELACLYLAADRERACSPVQLHRHAPGERTRIEQHRARFVGDGANLEPVGKGGRRLGFEFFQIRGRRAGRPLQRVLDFGQLLVGAEAALAGAQAVVEGGKGPASVHSPAQADVIGKHADRSRLVSIDPVTKKVGMEFVGRQGRRMFAGHDVVEIA